MKNIPKARKSGLIVQDLNEETLIYDLETNRAFCLNQTSMIVWQNCDGVKTPSDISKILTVKLKNPVGEDLVWLALDQLKKENLIENTDELETKFEGISRREAVRKIGLSSLVALPVIAALVAPTAAQTAVSACNTGTSCTCGNGGGTSCSSPACNAIPNCLCRNLGANNSGGQGQRAGTCGTPS